MGRQGDDGRVPAGGLVAATDGARGLEAVHFGHLHVHQDHVEGAAGRELHRLAAVVRHGDAVSLPLEHLHGHLLVEGVVLGQEDVQRAQRRRHGGGGRDAGLTGGRAGQRLADGIEQLRCADGLDQARPAVMPAALLVVQRHVAGHKSTKGMPRSCGSLWRASERSRPLRPANSKSLITS